MKKSLFLFSLLLASGLMLTSTLDAQTTVYSLGSPVEELSPLLKSTPGVCPTPAAATAVCDCPSGYVAVGYEGVEGNGYGAMVLSQFQLRCRELNADGSLGAVVEVTCANGSDPGNSPDGPADAATGEALVGFEVRIGCAIDGIQGFSKPIADIGAATPNSSSTAVASIGGMGGSAQPAVFVPDGNVIVGMQTYEDPGNNISAGVAWRYAPIVTSQVSGCNITSIALANASACNDNGTTDVAFDDFFTADVVVNFVDAPSTGTLDLSGASASQSVSVGSIGATSYTFTGVQLPASGGSIFLSAAFSDDAACSLSANAGTGPDNCSPDATDIPTMSEWGLILLTLIIFTLSVVFGTQHQRALAMANGGAYTSRQRSRLPFDRKAYFQVLPGIYLAIAAVFTAAIAFFGYELTNADIPGALLSGAIVAYLVHYVKSGSKH
ncbi:hypothetical protein [Phaeodactylibacter sp.]|uniref:hypothetical protein n=1 Tax=Phaeodactylibacter sp. TaxID=1940289 RepID=UPI0025F313C5|nr:hypothetical protein [Phaeodactylibacter sp.]MCI4647515.1 hypothetical protein [Phaeodactylibacter sp.]MCI5093592.1 hypothetical protein [Phaeodactylibacter sp.]